MVWAGTDLFAKLVERQRLIGMLFYQHAGALGQLGLGCGVLQSARPTAAAGPKASLLGRRRLTEKDHLLAPRPPRGAGWSAEDAGRAHGVDEQAVETCLARQHRLPAAFLIHGVPRFRESLS